MGLGVAYFNEPNPMCCLQHHETPSSLRLYDSCPNERETDADGCDQHTTLLKLSALTRAETGRTLFGGWPFKGVWGGPPASWVVDQGYWGVLGAGKSELGLLRIVHQTNRGLPSDHWSWVSVAIGTVLGWQRQWTRNVLRFYSIASCRTA